MSTFNTIIQFTKGFQVTPSDSQSIQSSLPSQTPPASERGFYLRCGGRSTSFNFNNYLGALTATSPTNLTVGKGPIGGFYICAVAATYAGVALVVGDILQFNASNSWVKATTLTNPITTNSSLPIGVWDATTSAPNLTTFAFYVVSNAGTTNLSGNSNWQVGDIAFYDGIYWQKLPVGYQNLGSWNASTNSPLLVSGQGTKNSFYIVSTAGLTVLDGISSWAVGDFVVFNGTAWVKNTINPINYDFESAVTSNADITVQSINNQKLKFENVSAGDILPIAVTQVYATGTNATNLIALQ